MFIYSFSRKDVKRALSALTTAVVCAAIIVISLLSTAKESLVAYAMLTRTVVIDAGHGGEDSGAVGVTGALEKELNLTFSLIIGEMLEREGIRVVYTRTTDALLLNDGEDVKGLR